MVPAVSLKEKAAATGRQTVSAKKSSLCWPLNFILYKTD